MQLSGVSPGLTNRCTTGEVEWEMCVCGGSSLPTRGGVWRGKNVGNSSKSSDCHFRIIVGKRQVSCLTYPALTPGNSCINFRNVLWYVHRSPPTVPHYHHSLPETFKTLPKRCLRNLYHTNMRMCNSSGKYNFIQFSLFVMWSLVSIAQSCPSVHFVWPDLPNPTHQLTDPTQPKQQIQQVERFAPNPTQPNTVMELTI